MTTARTVRRYLRAQRIQLPPGVYPLPGALTPPPPVRTVYCDICDSYQPAEGGERQPIENGIGTMWLCATCAAECPRAK